MLLFLLPLLYVLILSTFGHKLLQQEKELVSSRCCLCLSDHSSVKHINCTEDWCQSEAYQLKIILTGERLEVANSNGFRGQRRVQTYYIILQMFIQCLLCLLATI